MFARVLVDLKVKSLDRLFDYIIPSALINEVKVGSRVYVPFGEQKRLGFVIEMSAKSNKATREIIEVLDFEPTIGQETFLYLDYLKATNKTLLINIIETIIPSELFLNYDQTLILNNKDKISEKLLALFKNKTEIKYKSNLREYNNQIKRAIENESITLKRTFKQKGQSKIVQVINFNENHQPYKRIDNYRNLINFVKTNKNLTRQAILKAGFSLSAINTLIKNDIFNISMLTINRDVEFKATDKVLAHELTDEQEAAFRKIKNTYNKNAITLLKGVTGSGKTEIYMHLINDVLKNHQAILYLVPEITLVAPTVNYLKSRFKEQITHYNSSLSSGERYDAWCQIISGEAKIIVGTRSSSFLPISNLGLIIVDEEHDESYVQTERVQYNVLDILKIKSKFNLAPIVLGSATPKVTSMYEALKGNYHLAELNKRATNKPLPKISFVDMKVELENGNTSIFSKELKSAIELRLKNNEQVILLYNRKGYASFLLCRSCGHVPKCPNCDITLTYYKKDNKLRCNYCEYKEEKMTNCKKCQSPKVGEVGLGVEQVFEIVSKTFKNSKVLLMDQTQTRKKGSHEKIWLDFKNEKYNILVGTQMVSKGLDFPKVTLVGILMADLELKVPNYLASEHTYNLLTQMVGRSGRKIYGEAIIQGYNLEHYAIKLIDQPYKSFYKQAIYDREILKYEPFYEMSQVLVTNTSYLKAYQDALMFKKALVKKGLIVLGPTEPISKYLKNEFRFIMTIKSKQINYDEIFNLIDTFDESKISFIKIPEII